MKRPAFALALASGMLLCSFLASALDLPQQKPGLWEMRMQSHSDGEDGGRQHRQAAGLLGGCGTFDGGHGDDSGEASPSLRASDPNGSPEPPGSRPA